MIEHKHPHPESSSSMPTHLQVLKSKFESIGLTQRDVANLMGWKSNSTVSFKLNGKRDWSDGELIKMCEIAGITIVELSLLSDDFPLSKFRDSIEIAALADQMSQEKRSKLLELARVI